MTQKIMTKIFTSFLLLSYLCFANPLKAEDSFFMEVLNLRGMVTALLPHQKEPQQLKVGEKLPSDTSIVTGEKSFIRLRLQDGSILNIGPESKIAPQKLEGENKTLVGLLKGYVRLAVTKKEEQEENTENNGNKANKENKEKDLTPKVYIKTKTAVLGVRGTDFQTHYYPSSQKTALVAFKGEVGMQYLSREEETKFLENFFRSKEEGESKEAKEVNEVKQMEEVEVEEVEVENLHSIEGPTLIRPHEKITTKKKNFFLNVEERIVKEGQFTSTLAKEKTIGVPIPLEERQVNILYKKDFFTSKIERPKEEEKVRPKEVDSSLAKDVSSVIPIPKERGMIDLETGIYVAPGKERGVVDEGGNYIPPKGFIMTPKGLVATEESYKEQEKIIAQESAFDSYNAVSVTGYAPEVVITPKKKEEVPEGPPHLLSFMLGFFSLDHTKESVKTSSDSSLKRSFGWQFPYKPDSLFRLGVAVEEVSLKFPKETSAQSYWGMQLEGSWKLSKLSERVFLKSHLYLFQRPMFLTSGEAKKILSPRVGLLGLEYIVWEQNYSFLSFGANPFLLLSTDGGERQASNGYGVELMASGRIFLNSVFGISFKGSWTTDSQNHKVEGNEKQVQQNVFFAGAGLSLLL